MSGVFGRVRGLDAYARSQGDTQTRTLAGGLLTIGSLLLIAVLVVAEWIEYTRLSWRPELTIDQSESNMLTISYDISFPHVPCFALTLDVINEAGQLQNNVTTNVQRTRLSRDGKQVADFVRPVPRSNSVDEQAGSRCGSCYSASNGNSCCNSCGAVLQAYRESQLQPPPIKTISQCVDEGWAEMVDVQSNEGCRISGEMQVEKVTGSFHFAPGPSFNMGNYHLHDIRMITDIPIRFSHIIHHLAFGPQAPTALNLLDGHSTILAKDDHLFNYFFKVVSTSYAFVDGRQMHSNQYAVTQHLRKEQDSSVPSVTFHYDISPITINYRQTKKSTFAFLTSVCAIAGGVYALATLLDVLFYQAERRIRQKMEIGKAY